MPHRLRAAALVGVLLAFLTVGYPTPAANPVAAFWPALQSPGPNAIQRVSNGTDGQGGGTYASVSADSRYIVFESTAPDLAPGQIEDSWDVFMFDRQSGGPARVSTKSNGQPVYNSGAYSSPPAISSTGDKVVFMSGSADLVSGDDNGLPDIFVHDNTSGETRLVSRGYGGGSANGPSYRPVISRRDSQGNQYVAYQSMASNLVPNDNNDSLDIFVTNLRDGQTERVSVGDGGAEGYDTAEGGYSSVSISDAGRYVAFSYEHLDVNGQNGMVSPRIYIRDRQEGVTKVIATGEYPALSGTGRYLAFVSQEPLVPEDRNNTYDIYFVDRSAGGFERISVSSTGAEAPLQFIQSPPDLTDDGQFVVFASDGGLAGRDTAGRQHIFLRSRGTGVTSLISRNTAGHPADGDSDMAVIAGDGRCIAFTSLASDLVTGDTNGVSDVFIFDRTAQTVASFDYTITLPIIGR